MICCFGELKNGCRIGRNIESGRPCNFGSFDENDPESVAQKRKVGKGMGDQFAGPEFDRRSANWESDGDLGNDDDFGGSGGDDGDL